MQETLYRVSKFCFVLWTKYLTIQCWYICVLQLKLLTFLHGMKIRFFIWKQLKDYDYVWIRWRYFHISNNSSDNNCACISAFIYDMNRKMGIALLNLKLFDLWCCCKYGVSSPYARDIWCVIHWCRLTTNYL